MQAMSLTCPWQNLQVVRSMLNTRFRRIAQVIALRGRSSAQNVASEPLIENAYG